MPRRAGSFWIALGNIGFLGIFRRKIFRRRSKNFSTWMDIKVVTEDSVRNQLDCKEMR
ncbi:hypothetical protein RhiirA1_485527 [Rhizophagus irregularis]|uniref:Uncharacterized protein n=1 Tax=Rhizophagus irregularis TaxID=588596 RepID=A0A2N0QI34_9GLOM|nr:hypothetical protein RhiirA1_485527 [Rhizophagus irregularis]